MLWFPVRELDGLKFANRNGALNLEIITEQTIKLRMNTTSLYKGATAILKSGGKEIFRKDIDISP
ncbi:MAG: hypothetical protein HC906_04995, partial [Bacteroidales bacterium]|nr:hypothetical protein [Bacteroidales bacterium]